jgi:hypothetical protein
MRIRRLLLLLLPLLAACESKPKERRMVAAGPAQAIGAAQPEKAVARPQASPVAPVAAAAKFHGSVTPHLMKFARISEEEMQRKIAANQVEPKLLLGRFLLGWSDDYRSTLLYYRSPTYPDGWLETQFEPVGEWLSSQEVTLDTVRLEPTGPPAIIATFHSSGSLRHWSTTNEGINIIDVSKEPVLVLTAGTLSHEYAYGGDDDEADTTDADITANNVETVLSQAITVRKQLLVVGPAEEDGNYELAPAPPGTYRYRQGKMTRLRK